MVGIPSRQIKGFDQDIQNDYDRIQQQRRELLAKLAATNGEIGQAVINGGAAYAEGKSTKEYESRLPKLRLQAEFIQAAIDHIGAEEALLLRSNIWLKG